MLQKHASIMQPTPGINVCIRAQLFSCLALGLGHAAAIAVVPSGKVDIGTVRALPIPVLTSGSGASRF